MSTPNTDKRQGAVPTNALPAVPLTELEARLAEAEALQRTQDSSQETIESRRRGRIEAETRRISEEVTRQAQERVRLERLERLERAPRAHQAELTSGADRMDQTEIRDADEREESGEMQAPSRTLPEPAAIERVLVALDGTAYAERALPYAVALAARANASMVLGHVIETEPGRAHKAFAKLMDPTKIEAPMRGMQNIDTYLNTLLEQVATSVARVERIVLSADTASDGLVALVARADADVVALATHARQGVERRILGSVGDTLIQCTHVPLLLIPPGIDISDGTAPIFQRILVPLDGSMAAEEALAPILALAKSTAWDNRHNPAVMDIVLYYVADSRVTRPTGVHYVEEVRERLLRTGLPDTITITATAMVGSPPGSITSAAIHGLVNEPTYPARFDLVAMATHGRSGFQRWLYGSVAEYLLSHLSVPVLLVHPEQTDL